MPPHHAPKPPPPTGHTFTLTTALDNIAGGPGNDTFNGTFSDGGIGAGNTFQIGDILAGNGGIDKLVITPNHAIGAGGAATSLVDALWAHVTGIEDISITTRAGAQTITTGPFFEAAFAPAGVHLTTTSDAGAITVNMGTFTGAATLSTTSHAGAQTITTGSGLATVEASSGAGALTISGADLATVTATTTGAGAQTITSTGAGPVTVTATDHSGDQTITLGNGNNKVTVADTTGSGLVTITVGNGNNAVTAGGSNNVATVEHVTVGSGHNIITLSALHAHVDTLSFSAANGGSTTDFTTVSNARAADTITWDIAALNATIHNEGAVGSIALGIAGANLVDGYNTFTNGGHTYAYEYTGNPLTSELVGIVGIHTITASTAVAAIAT
jgi:hypothetical protein